MTLYIRSLYDLISNLGITINKEGTHLWWPLDLAVAAVKGHRVGKVRSQMTLPHTKVMTKIVQFPCRSMDKWKELKGTNNSFNIICQLITCQPIMCSFRNTTKTNCLTDILELFLISWQMPTAETLLKTTSFSIPLCSLVKFYRAQH